MTAVSVVIPTVRPPRAVAPTLRALARQRLEGSVEIIVVTDGPADAHAVQLTDVVRVSPYPITMLASDGVGRAAACDRGARAAQGEVLVFLDDDMRPMPDCLAILLDAVAGSADGQGPIAAMAAVPVALPLDAGPAARFIARRFERHLAKLAQPGSAIGVRDAYTGAFALPRSTYLEVGGFDRSFVEYGNEDGEFVGRLLAGGARLRLVPAAVAWQRYDKSTRELIDDHHAKGRSAAGFLARHPERADENAIRQRSRRTGRSSTAARLLAPWFRHTAGRRVLVPMLHGWMVVAPRLSVGLADRLTEIVLDAAFWGGVRAGPRARGVRGPAGTATVVLYTDATRHGGAERVVAGLARGLAASGERPWLVVRHRAAVDPVRHELVAAGVPILHLGASAGLARPVGFLRLVRLFRRSGASIVHVQRPWAPSGSEAIVAARLAGRRVVATEHLFLATTPRRVRWRRRWLDRRLVDRTIAVSSALARDVTAHLGVPRGTVRVVANGVDQPVAATSDSGRLRAAIGAGAGPLVLAPARLDRQKGLATLLAALTRLPDVTAAIAGDGPDYAALEALAKDLGVEERTRLLGWRDDLPALMAAADVVVLPSLAEGLPLALLEAMALGRPIVASAVGGIPEVLRDGREGRSVPPGDAERLAAAIRELLDDPERARRLGERARDRWRSGYSRDAMTNRTLAVYAELRGGVMADLRSLDWRFATGRDRFGRAARMGAAPDIGPIADQVVTLAGAEPASLDLVVAAEPGAAELIAARDALATSGTLVATTRRPRSMYRRIESIGWGQVNILAPWPRAADARHWLPLQDPAALAPVIGRLRPGVRARAAAITRRLWVARAWAGAAGPVVILAARPGGPQVIDAAWRTATGSDRPALTWRIATGGGAASSKAVAIATPHGRREPALVVKWPRTKEAGDGLEREAAVLDALAHDDVSSAVGAPIHHATITSSVGPALVESYRPGVPLARTLDATTYPSLVDGLTDRLLRLALATRLDDAAASEHRSTVLEAIVAAATEHLAPQAETVLGAMLADIPGLATVPLVREHRDAAPWNVLIDDRGAMSLVDWESSVRCGLPLVDLWYGLTYLALAAEQIHENGLVDAYPRLVDPASSTGRPIDVAVRHYADQLGLDSGQVRALRAWTWLIHVPAAARRSTDRPSPFAELVALEAVR